MPNQPSIRSGGHAIARQVEADFARQIREELDSMDMPEEYRLEREAARKRILALEEEAKRATLARNERIALRQQLQEEKRLVNKLKRMVSKAYENVKYYADEMMQTKPGRIASKAVRLGGRVAPIAGAAMTGYEAGQALDELSGGAISDYGSSVFDPITQRIYGQ